jgi:hypothetical protein
VEASRRLNRQIFPVLGETDVYLTVDLVILEQTSWMALEDERFLGFEPLWETTRGAVPVSEEEMAARRSGIGGAGGGRRAGAMAAAGAAVSIAPDRSRVTYRQHQVQLYSGPVKTALYQPVATARSAS